jgi:hypothetical protein
MTNANDFAYPIRDSSATQKGLTKREYISTSILSYLAALPSNTPNIDLTIKADVDLALKYTDELINALNNQP